MSTFTNISNELTIKTNGTSLQGFLHNVSYALLLNTFGEHNLGDEYKVDAEWDLEFSDGTIATIYNYKDGPNYNNGRGDVEDISTWHVGGKNESAVELVGKILNIGHQPLSVVGSSYSVAGKL